MMKIPFGVPALAARFKIIDLAVFFVILGIFSLILYVASGWRSVMIPSLVIDLDPVNIPYYAAQSLVRMFLAYVLSLLFSIWYGYTANRSKTHEQIMIPLLDVLQSIPVLSFLPGVVLAMIALFPERRIGLELASVLLIFTGQVWNMAFSYYNSINTMPNELIEVTRIYRHSRFTRFLNLDLPFSSIGLIWNSMMSVAGGWFFLMACEMFVLKDKDFRLPGLGSYIQTAANQGDMQHVLCGIGTMIGIIIFLDILVWRPVVAWSQKFRFDTVQAEDERESLVLEVLRKSSLAQRLDRMFTIAINRSEKAFSKMESTSKSKFVRILKEVVSLAGMALVVALFGWAIFQALQLLAGLSFNDYITVATAALFSVMRTTAALFLAFLWTVPLGVYIGLNPRASRVLQPLVQVVASIPATAVFPVILLFLIQLGGGLGIGSVFLMLLGTQWYILFNVIAGASAIPQDLKEVTKLYGLKGIEKWKVLILPGIFPYLVTGLITATGGAWNATIVSEYVTFGGETLKTVGLGSLIGESTANGNFGLLLMSTLVMAVIVVSINRLLWKRLFALAQEKYRLE
jgi:NitT/TauT family transport system permease protein